MGQPAVKANDRIVAQCATHQVPSPTGAPMVSPGPLPFSAPLAMGLANSVLVEGSPAGVQGSNGLNAPSHVGLHASDPYLAPPTQKGTVMVGSSTVMFEGKQAAYSGCQTSVCFQMPGQLTGTATSVMVAP